MHNNVFQRSGFSQVMDGELVFRINSKTIKKVNVTLGPPIKPQPTEKREPTDTNPAPSDEVDVDNNQSVEELSDNEAAEKENIENFEGTSQKAETARARVANKVKITVANKVKITVANNVKNTVANKVKITMICGIRFPIN